MTETSAVAGKLLTDDIACKQAGSYTRERKILLIIRMWAYSGENLADFNSFWYKNKSVLWKLLCLLKHLL